MKKEIPFPTNATLGARIHNERLKIDTFNTQKGAMHNRIAFYIAIHTSDDLKKFPSDSSMNKTVCNWENDSNPPRSVELLLRMSHLFDCDLGYLVGEQDTPHLSLSMLIEDLGLTGNAARKIRELYNLDAYHSQNHIEMIALNELLESSHADKILEVLFDLNHAEPVEHIFKCANGAVIDMTTQTYLDLRIQALKDLLMMERSEHKKRGCKYTEYYRMGD